MDTYTCTLCGYKYDPENETPETKFEDLPAEWVCPVCGAEKSLFEKD